MVSRRAWSSSVRLGSEEARPAVAGDRWNNWVFSVAGRRRSTAEESSRQAAVRRQRQRRPHHAGLEDHVRRRDRPRDRGVRPRRGRAGQGLTAASATSTGSSSRRSASTGRSAPPATSSRRRSTTSSWPSPRRRRSSATSFPTRPTRGGSCARLCDRRAAAALLRGDALRQDRGDAAAPRAVADARAARALGHARGAASSGRSTCTTSSNRGSRSKRRDVAARRARPLGRGRRSTPRAFAISFRCRPAARRRRKSCCGCASCRAATNTAFGISLTYTFGSIFSSIVNPAVRAVGERPA